MKYKLEQRINPQHPEAEPQWYATPDTSSKVLTDEVEEEIAYETTLTPTDTEAVLKSFAHVLPLHLAKGEPVNLRGVGTFRLGISSTGVEKPQDFDVSHITGHHILFTPDTSILKAIDTHIIYEDSGKRGGDTLEIYNILDVRSGKTNAVLSAGGSVQIDGQKMQIDGDDPSVGIKLIRIEDNTEYAIPNNDIPVNKSKEIVFVMPTNLPEGHYHVRIVTQYSESKAHPLKTPRTFTFERVLTFEDGSIHEKK